ncbi:hypothetical protein [Limimaricola pyoseonensis]|uniref:Uncharacterized protein n=1 Tax=Limimaricola pyoseonensis TaxID=521013 RepID=A0A1G7GRC2_9RHOB|nr:hypothetical protein [Limimaricola pyoseonensis]SDE90509.1 hypothetical protein SAMN04488567_2886 [Limimaricola pyoseonensis]
MSQHFSLLGLTARPVTGKDRLSDEVDRVQALLAQAQPPADCSPEIHAAPGRGPMRVLRQYETVMTQSGLRTRRATAEGFHPAATVDAFDRMELQARRRDPEGQPLFTVAQVEAGRTYAALVERVEAAGVRCSSIEGQDRAGDGSASWIDALIHDIQRYRGMLRAIGDEVVLTPQRRRADDPRRTIRARQLVDAVCIEGRTSAEVRKAQGWGNARSANAALIDGLTGALDRLYAL